MHSRGTGSDLSLVSAQRDDENSNKHTVRDSGSRTSNAGNWGRFYGGHSGAKMNLPISPRHPVRITYPVRFLTQFPSAFAPSIPLIYSFPL